MKYKNIAFIIIILSLWINPVNADSKVAPYADIPTQHSANWPENYMDAEFIQANNNDRIRQNGDISKIKFDVANTSNLMEFYFTIWRKNDNGGYGRIAITDNLNGDISDGINEIELSVPISGVQEGDYYGYRIKTSGPALYVDTSEVRLTYFVNNSASPIENFDWEGCIDWRPYIFVIEPYMDDPHMIFIGDSIIVGIPQHLSFLHEDDRTDIPSTIEYQWSNKVDDQIYQNMGYGGHGTPELRNRFNEDVVQLNPEFALIEGGIIDIRRSGDRSGVIINNWRAMIEEAYNNDITPVIMLILPCTDISDLRSGRVDIINEQLITMAAEYSPSIVVDARSYVGIDRDSGAGGNLWDINPDYDSGDGLHFNSAGNERIAQAIKDSFKYIYGKPGLYNLIQSDGTIIYSEGLSNAINTSWRMASTSSTANVTYNEPSIDEIADFTINNGSIKWFTIYDLSQDQVYHLRRSDGTLIESSTALNGIVNFTMTGGLSTGTYHVDTSFVITDVNYDIPATDSVNITWETNKNSDSLVQYGTTSGNYSSDANNQEMVISHSIELSGLSPGITYYFIVTSTDFDNDLAQSDEYFFTTADIADTTPPVISNITNTTPATDSVTISWDTDEDSDSLVKYGTESGSYIVEVPDIALLSSHSIELSGLNSNTTYYYVVNSTDTGSNSAQSDEYFFTTADIADTTPPVIFNITNTTPATDSVTISWDTDEDSDSLVKYGTESGSYIVEVPDIALLSSHSIELSGLNFNTTYYYVVNSTDAGSNSAQSDEYNFTTADIADTTPPVIYNITNTTPTTDSVTIGWETDEDSESLVKYGTESGSYIVEVPDIALLSSHSIELSGLNFNTTYYYVVNSTDAGSNSAQSDEYNFTTADIADTTPPVIYNITNTTPTTDSVTIGWETDEDSESLVKYGTESGSYIVEVPDIALVSSHSIELSGLNSNTTYYYVVNSTDAGSNSAQSDEYNFTIFANDTSGNMPNRDQVNITVEENISITISIASPCDGYYTSSMSIVVTGYVDGNGSVPTVVVNEVEAEIDLVGFAGNYTATVPLNVGTNSITVTAYTINEKISDSVKVFRKKVSTSSRKSGGGGAAGEDFNNIMISETQREFVCIGEDISYVFDSEDNIVRYINFTGYKTAGTIPAKVDMLNHTSSLVNYAPLDIVYKNLNIWVGNKGWANSKNIGNATISFNLEKSWINENNIDRSTIKMKRYYNGKWNILETTLIDQDVKYLYFESKIAGFSSFVITGKQRYTGEPDEPDEPGEEGIEDDKPVAVVTETLNNTSVEAPTGDEIGIPGFGLFICLVVGLMVIWKIRKE
jgi:PGF-pre-PGF domain-containing protein